MADIAYVGAVWTCNYAVYGCLDPIATNFRSYVTVSLPGVCQYAGCNDTDAKNFDSTVRYPPTP